MAILLPLLMAYFVKKERMMMLSLLLIPFVLFSACGFPQDSSPAEVEPPAQVQSVQTEEDEPAETVPSPAELLYQGKAGW